MRNSALFCVIAGGSKAARGNSNILTAKAHIGQAYPALLVPVWLELCGQRAKREAKQYDLHKGFDWSQAVC